MDDGLTKKELPQLGRYRPRRLTVREIMIFTGGLGSFLGLYLRDPEGTLLGGFLLLLFWLFGKAAYFRLSLATRLSIEIMLLLFLLTVSSCLWMPPFYSSEANRCESLGMKARSLLEHQPGRRTVLDHEAAWFERRARELRWKGWWLGLTLGPRTRDDELADLEYEFGTLESIEKHEKRLKAFLENP